MMENAAPANVSLLQNELKQLLEEREDLRQKVHDQNRLLAEQKVSIASLTQDCYFIQGKHDELKEVILTKENHIVKLSKKVKDLEDRGPEEKLFSSNEKACQKLTTKVGKDVKLLQSNNEALQSEINRLNLEISDGKKNAKKLLRDIEAREELLAEKVSENVALESALLIAQEQAIMFQDRLKASQDDLMATKEILQETRDELMQTKSELHIAQGPVMASRGNSVFQELEDSRQQILIKYNNLKVKYAQAHKRSAKMSKDMSKLLVQKSTSTRVMKELANSERESSESMIRSLERRISEQEEYNRQLEQQLKVPIKILSEVDKDSLKFMETMIADAKQAEWKMSKRCDEKSMELLLNQQNVNLALSEVRELKAANIKLRDDICEMTAKLISYATVEEKSPLKEVTNEIPVTDMVANKENDNRTSREASRLSTITRKVTFSDEDSSVPSVNPILGPREEELKTSVVKCQD